MNHQNQSTSMRPSINDEGLQRMIYNNVIMNYSKQMVVAQNIATRPVNSTKAYASNQEECKIWCSEEQKIYDGEIVHDGCFE
ncbi:MAG: hypothetical protein EXX96DRAFT_654725 [Benjaminiella poitrasii]|nr:MAG: hypothetical protein EXX96DRAFT_654725 [Benjaminiella poitrasii]